MVSGETAACLAVLYNNRDALAALMNAGCDLNIPDVPRKPPLLLAVESSKVKADIVELLVKGKVPLCGRLNSIRKKFLFYQKIIETVLLW